MTNPEFFAKPTKFFNVVSHEREPLAKKTASLIKKETLVSNERRRFSAACPKKADMIEGETLKKRMSNDECRSKEFWQFYKTISRAPAQSG
jgi:hypothetical protein